jgi:hypothetical protein
MSNYSKYLQASFLPLRLPVAEALWSVEKDCSGKNTSYTVAGKNAFKHTEIKSVTWLCL